MASTYEPIATTTLGSATNSIVFSSISSAYTDLKLIFVGKADASAAGFTPRIQFNSDTATNYSRTSLYGNGTSAASNAGTGQIALNTSGAGAGLSTTQSAFMSWDIFSYAGSTYKTVLVNQNSDYNGSGGVDNTVGLWRSTSAINSINVSIASGNFTSGTTLTLYGIKAA